MTNILEKIIAEKKHSIDLIKKEKSLDSLENYLKYNTDTLYCV